MQNWSPQNTPPFYGQNQPLYAYPPSGPAYGYPYGYVPPYMLRGPHSDFEYASLRRRYFALSIDSVIALILGIMAVVVLDQVTGIRLFVWDFSSETPRISISGWPLALASFAYTIPQIARGATLGKRALGLRVTNEQGHAPGYQRSILRVALLALSQLLSPLVFGLIHLIHHGDPAFQTAVGVTIALSSITILASLAEFAGCMSAKWDNHRQALHDKIAGTYVIHHR